MFKSLGKFFISPVAIGDMVLFFSPLDVMLKLVLPIIVSIVVYKLLLFLLKKMMLKAKARDELKEKLMKYSSRIIRVFVSLLFLAIVSNFLGEEIAKYFSGFIRILTTPFFTAGSSTISLVTIMLTIPVFLVSSWLSKKMKIFLETSILKSLTLPEATKFSLANLLRYGVQIILILIGLSVIGIDFSSIAVILGVLGIGVGFGLQGVVSNLFAGIVIFFERPVKEGDRIIINGIEGDVVKIRILSTVVNTLTNETIFVPNAQLVGNHIHNFSYETSEIILVVPIQVAYGSDLDRISTLLKEIGRENPFCIKKREPVVRLLQFDSSGINMEVRIWIRDARDKPEALSWTNFKIWRRFKENNIQIPFPQLDLHIKR